MIMNLLTKILGQIGNELTNQISLAKNMDEKINTQKLFQQSNLLNKQIISSNISNEEKLMLQKFSSTLIQKNSTARELRYEKQDLERVLSNLNDAYIHFTLDSPISDRKRSVFRVLYQLNL